MRHLIVVLLAATLVGCASAPAPTAVAADDVKALVGSWQGWLVTERGFNLINFEIRADGSFEVSGRSVRASGILAGGRRPASIRRNRTVARDSRARGKRRASCAPARA